MRYRNSLLFTALFLIIAICWFDNQYFSEGVKAYAMSNDKRRLAHIVLLAAVVPVGYLGWYWHSMQWIKKLWLSSYLIAMILLLAIGLMQWMLGIFSTSFLDGVMSFRTFFCSPLPFLILYVLSKVAKNLSAAS